MMLYDLIWCYVVWCYRLIYDVILYCVVFFYVYFPFCNRTARGRALSKYTEWRIAERRGATVIMNCATGNARAAHPVGAAGRPGRYNRPGLGGGNTRDTRASRLRRRQHVLWDVYLKMHDSRWKGVFFRLPTYPYCFLPIFSNADEGLGKRRKTEGKQKNR